jgi:hypothetical protein
MPLAQPPNAQSQFARASTDKTTFHRSDLSPQTHCRPEDINRRGGGTTTRAPFQGTHVSSQSGRPMTI